MITSKAIVQLAVSSALSRKAEDVCVLDLTQLYDVTDAFVLASGASEIQVKAIADVILEAASQEGLEPFHVEGRNAGRWVLLDFVDVVVHVMLAQARDYYALERLWGDAPLTRFDDEGRPRVVRPKTADTTGQEAQD